MTEPTTEPATNPPTGGQSKIASVLLVLAYLFAVFIAQAIATGLTLGVIGALFGTRRLAAGNLEALSQPEFLPVFAILMVVIAAVVIAVTFVFVVYVDRRPWETLGLKPTGAWTRDLAWGAGIGAVLILLMFIVSYAAGWSRVDRVPGAESPIYALLMGIILMAGVAVSEEVMMRGYVLQRLGAGFGAGVALVASAVFFGVLHLGNPDASFPGFLGTAAAGLLLGYGYLVTRKLWYPIGLHFAWNFVEGSVLGFPVSGLDLPSLVEQRVAGPALWTGGAFGPEAGLLAILAVALGVGIVWAISRRY